MVLTLVESEVAAQAVGVVDVVSAAVQAEECMVAGMEAVEVKVAAVLAAVEVAVPVTELRKIKFKFIAPYIMRKD